MLAMPEWVFYINGTQGQVNNLSEFSTQEPYETQLSYRNSVSDGISRRVFWSFFISNSIKYQADGTRAYVYVYNEIMKT